MMEYVLQSSFYLSVFVIGYFLFLRTGKYFYFNRLYLLFALILSITIPLVEIDISNVGFEPDFIGQVEEIQIPLSTWTEELNISENADIGANTITWKSFLFWTYLLGVCVMLFRYVKGLWYFKRLINQSGKQTLEDNRLVVLNQEYSSPFSFFNYIFIHQKDLESNAIDEKVVYHETIHSNHRHTWDILIMELFLVFHYFNPLVWIYRYFLRMNHEYVVDQKVIEKYPDVEEYAHQLINTHSSGSRLFESGFYLSTKKRLIMFTKTKKSPITFTIRALLALIVSLGIFSIFSFTNTKDSLHSNVSGQFTVVIDLGHGGKDPGAKNEAVGISESELLDKIGAELNDVKTNLNLVFTRTENRFLTLPERIEIVNEVQADLLVSLHVGQNLKNPELSGVEVFCSDSNGEAEKSIRIGKAFVENLKWRNTLGNNRLKKADLYMTKNAGCPAVLLNLGYLSNIEDLSFIQKEENQKQLAKGIIEILTQIKYEFKKG